MFPVLFQIQPEREVGWGISQQTRLLTTWKFLHDISGQICPPPPETNYCYQQTTGI